MLSRLVIPKPRPTDKLAGHVYLISEPYGLYKIGHTTDVSTRLTTLQLACPYNLTLLDSVKVEDRREAESFIHGLLAAYRERGEWFRLPNGTVTWNEAIDQYHTWEQTKFELPELIGCEHGIVDCIFCFYQVNVAISATLPLSE